MTEYRIDTSDWNKIISVSAGRTLTAQGHNGDGQVDIDEWTNIIAIATGWRHTVGLNANGDVFVTGYRSESQMKQISENSEGWINIVAIAAGGGSNGAGSIQEKGHTVALRNDGRVVAVGDNELGQCDVSEWTDIVAIAAGDFHTVGLKSDGTVITTQTGQSANEISEWTDIVAVSAGYGFTLGLKADGTVVAAGYDKDGQCDVETWTNIISYDE